MIAETPVARPSRPSVRFAPFDTAVTMKMTMMIYKSQVKSLNSPAKFA
jgi:hypothetical protein